MNDFRALVALGSNFKDSIYNISWERVRMMMRPRWFGWNNPPAAGGIELHPAAYCARFNAYATSDLAHAPAAIANEAHRVSAHYGHMWICYVWHIHIILLQGVAKVLNHDRLLTGFCGGDKLIFEWIEHLYYTWLILLWLLNPIGAVLIIWK